MFVRQALPGFPRSGWGAQSTSTLARGVGSALGAPSVCRREPSEVSQPPAPGVGRCRWWL